MENNEDSLVSRKGLKQFILYFFCGGIATVFDWTGYALCSGGINLKEWIPALPVIKGIGLHHVPSVIIAYTIGGLVNYTLNKIITFRDKTRMIGAQMGIYAVVMALAYGLNVVLMLLLVDLMGLEDFLSRMITTGIVFIYNFLMHRSFTFNKKFHAKLNIR